MISIIIPSYNRAHLLGETLDSIILQTYKNWECLVVDDGSSDYTKELMEFYKEKDLRISYYNRPKYKRKGANACRNYGFKLSKGEYVNWFDDDDIMHIEKLEVQVRALQDSDYNFSVCQSKVFEDETENILGLRHNQIWSPFPFEDYLKMKIIWLTQPPLWKRSFLIRLNYLFDEYLTAAQEWEFHCRAIKTSPKYHYTNTPLVFLRKHSQSITYRSCRTARTWNYFLARLKIYRNKELELERSSMIFLRKYLLDSFKKMIRTQNPYAIKAYTQFIIPESNMNLKSKFYALLAILSYNLVGKGNNIHQKIKYKE